MVYRRSLLLLTILLGCNKSDRRIPTGRQELDSFAKSVREYRDQKGHWPPSLIEAVGRTCLGESHDCVSADGKRLDPWGSVYEYDQSLHGALVRSAGPDKHLGTRDDIEVNVRGSEAPKAAGTPDPSAPTQPAPAPDAGAPR